MMDRARIEAVLRERYGDRVVDFVHYPGIGQVAVRFVDGVKRLHDHDGSPIGRDLPPRTA
jgi:hypothetical protein